jgi:hypothetical protein
VDTAPIAGIWQAPALRRNTEAALREHIHAARAGGHLRVVYDQLYPPVDRGCLSEVDNRGRYEICYTRSSGYIAL